MLKDGQVYFKSLSSSQRIFSKYVWPFFNKVNKRFNWIFKDLKAIQ